VLKVHYDKFTYPPTSAQGSLASTPLTLSSASHTLGLSAPRPPSSAPPHLHLQAQALSSIGLGYPYPGTSGLGSGSGSGSPTVASASVLTAGFGSGFGSGSGLGAGLRSASPLPAHARALGMHPLSLAHSVHSAHSYSHPDRPPGSSTLGSSSLAAGPSSTLNSSIMQSLTSTMRQTQSQPQGQSQTSPLPQSQTYSPAQRQQHSQQTQTHPGQIKLPPGFMYDYGPPSGPSSPYEMFGLGAQQQVGISLSSLSFFSGSAWLRPSFVFGVLFLVGFRLYLWDVWTRKLYASGSLPFHSTLVEAAYAILSSFILHIMDC